jgi:hypothetical protein
VVIAGSASGTAKESDPMGEISKNAEEILTILNREMAGNHVFAGIAVVAIEQADDAPQGEWIAVLRLDSAPSNSSFISLVGRLNGKYRLRAIN